MKQFILIILSLFLSNSFVINAQRNQSISQKLNKDIIEIKSISSENTDYSDLMPLKKLLVNSRIVLLGEQTHGGGSTYSAKVRLVKFLHQEMGFEVMAFESGMYDCAKIWQQMQQGIKMKDAVLNSMFYMYATSNEVKPLFDYIDEQNANGKPFIFCGMDSQHTGEKSKDFMSKELKTFLEKNGSKLTTDKSWQTFERKTDDLVAMKRKTTPEDKKTFYQVVENIKAELNNIKQNSQKLLENSFFWLKIVESLESQAKRYWGDVKDIDRDRQMAENMSWLLNGPYKGKKVIIWAHNFHIARGIDPVLPMGYFLKKEYKDQMYAIGFTGYNGTFVDFVSGKKATIKNPSKKSIEQNIKSTGYKYAMIDLLNLDNNHWLKQNQKGRLFTFSEQKVIIPNIFDGLFYIETTTPTVRE